MKERDFLSTYRHGAYAIFEPSGLTVAAESGTLPVYFGVAPIHQLPDPAGKTGIPLLLENNARAQALAGYSENWADFSLCEALYVHFRSGAPIGPIVVVNVFDPAIHREDAPATAEVLFAAGRGRLPDGKAILGTIAMEGKEPGTDFTAAYDDTGAGVVITDPTGALTGQVAVTYTRADPSAVTTE